MVDGHLELPDLRIEYKTEDGRIEHRDVGWLTEHYSRGPVTRKDRAGFTCYRAGGSSSGKGQGGTPWMARRSSGATVMTFDERVRALEPLGLATARPGSS